MVKGALSTGLGYILAVHSQRHADMLAAHRFQHELEHQQVSLILLLLSDPLCGVKSLLLAEGLVCSSFNMLLENYHLRSHY